MGGVPGTQTESGPGTTAGRRAALSTRTMWKITNERHAAPYKSSKTKEKYLLSAVAAHFSTRQTVFP